MKLTATLLLLACVCGLGDAKRTPQAVKTDKASKKQDMLFNENEQHSDEGPIGKPQSAGIEGLGGEMNGYPTGMGAGAEPLGAFENEETPSLDMSSSENQQQNIDDKSSNFASPQENDQSPIRGGNDDNDDGPTGGEGMMKMKAQPVSMGNNLKDELNTPGVNIQGDGEIGRFVLNAQRKKQQQQQQGGGAGGPGGPGGPDGGFEIGKMYGGSPEDPPFTGGPDGVGMNKEGAEDQASKRHLAKQKSNRKKNAWKKPFKKIQKKKQ